MAKKYVNGYKAPRIKSVMPGGAEKIYDFSFKYEKFKEYYEKISTKFELPDGSKKKKIRYVNYEWDISLETYGEAEDILKFRDIENDEINGAELFLTPHIDYDFRVFKILIKDEKRELTTIVDNSNTAMEGYRIAFENAERITSVNTADTDFTPVYAFEEDY